jgi:hypothetical protein
VIYLLLLKYFIKQKRSPMVGGMVGGVVGGIVLAAKSHPQDRTPA